MDGHFWRMDIGHLPDGQTYYNKRTFTGLPDIKLIDGHLFPVFGSESNYSKESSVSDPKLGNTVLKINRVTQLRARVLIVMRGLQSR